MSDNIFDKKEKEEVILKDSDFTWESLGSIESRRKNAIIRDIYNMRTVNDEVVAALKQEWDSIVDTDIDTGLESQFNKALEVYENRKTNMTSALEIKQQLVEEAEANKDSSDWRKTSQLLKELQQKWKETGFAGNEQNDSLWKRFQTANDHFFERRNEFYKDLAVEQADALAIKEDLIAKAEAVKDSTAWKESSAVLKDLMDQWKKSGFAGKNQDKQLWNRFNGARQEFYNRQNEYFDTLNQDRTENRTKKSEIIQEALEYTLLTNYSDNKEKVDKLLEKWKEIGSAGFKEDQELWEQFNHYRNEFYIKLRGIESASKEARREKLIRLKADLNNRIDTLLEANEGLNQKRDQLLKRLDNESLIDEDKENLTEEVSKLKAFIDNNENTLNELYDEISQIK